MKTIAYAYRNLLLESDSDLSFSGWEIDYLYQDFDERLELTRLLLDCQNDPPERIIIRSLVELGNSLEEISDRWQKIEELGIELIAIDRNYRSSHFNAANPERLKTKLASLLQEIQKQLQQNKLREGQAKNRLKILPPPGKAPYGYRRGRDKYIVDRSTAPVVKEFFDRFLLFGSLRDAVRFLETRYGKKISVSTGKKWLADPVYRGNLLYQKKTIITGTHAAIIPPEEAAQIDRILRRNSRLPPRTASAPRSLAGLVFCDRCRSSMKISRTTTRNKKKEYLYLCPVNCPLEKRCSAIAYQEILEKTIERICCDLPLAVNSYNFPDINIIERDLRSNLERDREILKQIDRLQQEKVLDENTANYRRYQLRAEIAELENKIASLPPVSLKAIAKTVSFSQFWLDLSETERRFYFREFIREIRILRSQSQAWQIRLVFIFLVNSQE